MKHVKKSDWLENLKKHEAACALKFAKLDEAQEREAIAYFKSLGAKMDADANLIVPKKKLGLAFKFIKLQESIVVAVYNRANSIFHLNESRADGNIFDVAYWSERAADASQRLAHYSKKLAARKEAAKK